MMMFRTVLFTLLVVLPSKIDHVVIANEVTVDCKKDLLPGQFMCPDPDPKLNYIDPKTQQPVGCTKEGRATGILISCRIIFTVTRLFTRFYFANSSLHSGRRHQVQRHRQRDILRRDSMSLDVRFPTFTVVFLRFAI